MTEVTSTSITSSAVAALTPGTIANPALAKGAAPVSQSEVSRVNLQQKVNATQGAKAPVPAGLVVKNTKDLISLWLRGCIYGETDSWKTTTAALFGSVEDVRIILTRAETQLAPVRKLGYQYAHCDTYSKFRYAMMYPEQLFGAEWAARANKVVVIDDVSEAKELVVDNNETDDEGKVLKDTRMVHREAKGDMLDMVRSLQSKPMHVLFIALAKIYENKFTRRETISPDLPAAMANSLAADWDFIFYSDKVKKMLLTSNRVENYEAKDDKGKLQSYTRSIFAKHKISRDLVGTGFLAEYEKHDLAPLWAKILSGKVAPK